MVNIWNFQFFSGFTPQKLEWWGCILWKINVKLSFVQFCIVSALRGSCDETNYWDIKLRSNWLSHFKLKYTILCTENKIYVIWFNLIWFHGFWCHSCFFNSSLICLHVVVQDIRCCKHYCASPRAWDSSTLSLHLYYSCYWLYDFILRSNKMNISVWLMNPLCRLIPNVKFLIFNHNCLKQFIVF